MTVEPINSQIWSEVPEPDDPFSAQVCRVWGYDLFGDLLRNASWSEYLYLLFAGEKPDATKARLLEAVALVLADPGMRDPSVRAAMNGGVGGSRNAANLMAALAVGAGQLGGAREIYLAVKLWKSCGADLSRWQPVLGRKVSPKTPDRDGFEPMEYPPGFSPYACKCPRPVRQALDYLSEIDPHQSLAWLRENRSNLESMGGYPLALSGVVAAAFDDLRLNPDQAEALYLILRLPGAAVHALEQKKYGWRRYPFFAQNLIYQQSTADSGSAARMEVGKDAYAKSLGSI